MRLFLFITLLAMGLVALLNILSGNPITFVLAVEQVVQNKIYQGFLIVAVVFSARLILFRLRDRDLN